MIRFVMVLFFLLEEYISTTGYDGGQRFVSNSDRFITPRLRRKPFVFGQSYNFSFCFGKPVLRFREISWEFLTDLVFFDCLPCPNI